MTSNYSARALSRLLLSNLSDAISIRLFDTVIALTVVLHLNFSATELGLLNFLGAIAFFALSVPVGYVVDRVGAVRALLLSLSGKLVFLLAVAVLYYCELLNTATTMALVTGLGVLTIFTETCQTTVVPLLVNNNKAVANTVARLASADQAVSVIVPVLGGLLFTLSGGLAGLLAATVFAAAALLTALRVRSGVTSQSLESDGADPADSSAENPADNPANNRADNPTESPADTQQVDNARRSSGFLAGFSVIFANRTLLATTLLVAAANIGLAIGDTLTDLLLLRYMGVSPFVFGLLEGLGAIAGFVAALITPRLLARVQTRHIFGLGGLAQTAIACLPLVALTVPMLGYIAMTVLSAAWAFVVTITNIAGSAYAAEVVPQRLLGRSTGARRMIVMGAVPFAALGSGLLADSVGLMLPLLLWPLITLVAVVFFFMLTGQNRHR